MSKELNELRIYLWTRQRPVKGGPWFQITTEGRTVWVNKDKVGAVGRLGPYGIDIHGPENTSCQDCGAHAQDEAAWERFVTGMKTVHGVEIPSNFKPDWIK